MLNVGPKQAINNIYEILYGSVNKFFSETLGGTQVDDDIIELEKWLAI